jgi:hypothetical protein
LKNQDIPILAAFEGVCLVAGQEITGRKGRKGKGACMVTGVIENRYIPCFFRLTTFISIHQSNKTSNSLVSMLSFSFSFLIPLFLVYTSNLSLFPSLLQSNMYSDVLSNGRNGIEKGKEEKNNNNDQCTHTNAWMHYPRRPQ